jgi:hypothetical protein
MSKYSVIYPIVETTNLENAINVNKKTNVATHHSGIRQFPSAPVNYNLANAAI